MTTKEQEKKALSQIRRIVDGLGEDSYIGTAFEGCFEIAERNIDNDWACSMKQRADNAQEEAEKLRSELNIANASAKSASKAEQAAARRAEASEACADALRVELEQTKKQLQDLEILAAQVREHARETYKARIATLERLMIDAAEAVAVFAGTPKDIAFTHSVEQLRKYKTERDSLQAGLDLIQKLGE